VTVGMSSCSSGGVPLPRRINFRAVAADWRAGTTRDGGEPHWCDASSDREQALSSGEPKLVNCRGSLGAWKDLEPFQLASV
jgi:hypothetical protein